MTYIAKHWRGELSLAVAFWINLVVVNIVLNILSSVGLVVLVALVEVAGYTPTDSAIMVGMLVLMLAYILLSVWQLVGTWRSARRHIQQTGRYGWAIVTKILVFLGWCSLLFVLLAVLMAFTAEDGDWFESFDTEQVRLDDAGHVLFVNGYLDRGLANYVDKQLAQAPLVQVVALNSEGGLVAEGRKLGEVISNYGLNTYVSEYCASACTLAFIGGYARYLAPGANLAFHQYSMENPTAAQEADLKLQQYDDMQLFRLAGASENFVQSMFLVAADDLWYPTIDELIEHGVVTAVAPLRQLVLKLSNQHAGQVTDAYQLADEAFSQLPPFITIAEQAPEVYQEILNEFVSLYQVGADFSEIQLQVANYVNELKFNALLAVPDKVVIEYMQAELDIYRALVEQEPILCMKVLYPDSFGNIVFTNHFDQQFLNNQYQAVSSLLSHGLNQEPVAINHEGAENDLPLVLEGLDDWLPYLQNLGSDRAGYANHCQATIQLYESILTRLPSDQSANMLRWMMVP